MRKYIIAAHGKLAGGMQSALNMIMGATENIFILQAYIDENKRVTEEMDKILDQIKGEDELIIFTDLLGGSVTNQMLPNALKFNVYLVSGFNLPLLLEIILADPEIPIIEVIEKGISNAREQIVFVNKLINK